VGAAVLAATPHLGGCAAAIAAMVRIGQRVEPDPQLAAAYDDQYARFRTALQERGYR
jgi:sugar (pentulose or hexulose) kinase